MGSAPIYITAASGAYLSATVSWDSSGLSSGSSVTVYIDVSSSGGWRLKKGSTVYFERQGNLSSSFTGNVGSTYQFQLWDTIEQTYQLQNFTVTQDSSGGGDSGGGDSPSSYYLSYYDSNGDLLTRTTETAGKTLIAQSGSSVTKPDSSSTNNDYTITGDANGGTFSNGSTTASITATETITISYSFSKWNTDSSGTGGSLYAGSSFLMPEYNLNLYPIFSSSSSTSYSNNSLSRLPQPSNTSSATATLTAIFNANGGSVSTTSQSVNTTVTKTFGGWMSSSTGTTTINSLNSAGTVYAKWNDSYSNATVILPLPTRNGYIFDGWSTSTSGTNLQQAGTQVSISGNTTFYAIWTEKEKPKGGVFIHDGTMWQLVSS